jgi:vacuolar-type H+-ATPase subunit F/Vma7
MSHAVRVICRPSVSTGFALAGLRTLPANTPGEAWNLLRDIRQSDDIGLVLIEQSLYDGIPRDFRVDLARRPLPMLVAFAGPTWEKRPDEADRYIMEMLRQAVGYRVRLT